MHPNLIANHQSEHTILGVLGTGNRYLVHLVLANVVADVKDKMVVEFIRQAIRRAFSKFQSVYFAGS